MKTVKVEKGTEKLCFAHTRSRSQSLAEEVGKRATPHAQKSRRHHPARDLEALLDAYLDGDVDVDVDDGGGCLACGTGTVGSCGLIDGNRFASGAERL